MSDYIVGQVARIPIPVRNDAGTAIDPSTLTFIAEKPDDTEIEYVWQTDAEVVKDSVGNFHVDLPLDQAGLWSYRVETTGTGEGAGQGVLEVVASLIDVDGVIAELLPEPSAVAKLLRDRTTDNNSVEVGDFTANTRPTALEVQGLIHEAANDVAMAVGTSFTDQRQRVAARSLITLGASLLVELSFFRNQLRNDSDAYDRAKDLYDERLKRLIEAVAESGSGGDGASVATAGFLPTGCFPTPEYAREPGGEEPR